MLSSDDPEARKRAHYRLGLIEQQKNNLQSSLQHLYNVTEIDPDFLKLQVNLRIAEICYKLNNIEDSFKSMARLEHGLKPHE